VNTNPQVLVIGDDAVVGRTFDRVLSGKGYEVSTALNGEDALQSIEDTEFDVVFTDIRMPGMDGLEVARRIKDKCPWTPVVVVTGYGTPEYEARASVLGVNGFVRKPLTPEIIESITLKTLRDAARIPDPETRVQTPVDETAQAVTETSALKRAGVFAKNVALFFAAPFIALGYVFALPAVGFYMVVKLSYQAVRQRRASS